MYSNVIFRLNSKELRERDISTTEEAKEYLEEFRLKYNKRFVVAPAEKLGATQLL